LSLPHRVQTGRGALPASSPLDTGDFSPELKLPGGEVFIQLPLIPECKNAWNHSSTPPIRLHGVVLVKYV
jgi:hypothetical protein